MKKKLLGIIVSMLLIATVFSVAGIKNLDDYGTMAVETKIVDAGDENVLINITGEWSTQLFGYTVVLQYDTSIIESLDVIYTDTIGEDAEFLDVITLANGLLYIYAWNEVNVLAEPGTGLLFQLEVDISSNAEPGNTTLNLLDAHNSYLTGYYKYPGFEFYISEITDGLLTVQGYTLTINVEGEGTVEVDPSQGQQGYGFGTEITLTAIPEIGWDFNEWSDDLSGTNNPETLVIDEDKVVTATFIAEVYTLTVHIEGSGTVDINPPGEYYYGDEVTLTAIPDSDWVFDKWSGDLSGSINPDTIIMDGNKEVTASFIEYVHDEWPMMGHDPCHSSFSLSNTPESVVPLFSKSIDGVPASSGIAINGRFIFALKDNLYCINPKTGSDIWKKSTYGQISSSPATDGNLVFVGSENGNLYAVDIETGNSIWELPLDGEVRYAGITLVDDKLFFGTDNSTFYCVDTEGNVIWTNESSLEGIFCHPAVADNKVYFGAGDDKVYCLDVADGGFVWSYTTGGNVGTPVVNSGKVYVISGDNLITCLDAVDGSFNWNAPAKYFFRNPVPTVYDNKVYIHGQSGFLTCLNASDGSELWRHDDISYGAPISISVPVVAEGKVFYSFLKTAGVLNCLDADNGSVVWVEDLGGSQGTPRIFSYYITLYRGVLYLPGDFNVYAYGAFYNSAPPTPNAPTGPTEGVVGEEYCFVTDPVEDPEGDIVLYKFDWGDGEDDLSLTPEACYDWKDAGVYDIKVQTKDIFGDSNGEWSDPLTITIHAPELSIENVAGGSGLTVTLKNNGGADAEDVRWDAMINGGFFILNDSFSGDIPLLSAGESTDITLDVFGFGLGILSPSPTVTFIASTENSDDAEVIVTAKILLSFTFGIEEVDNPE